MKALRNVQRRDGNEHDEHDKRTHKKGKERRNDGEEHTSQHGNQDRLALFDDRYLVRPVEVRRIEVAFQTQQRGEVAV